MKLSEFSKSAPPVSPGVSPSSPQEPENASLEAPQEEQYNQVDLAWAGGLFDGEGSFVARKKDNGRASFGAHVHMCDEDSVRRFHEVVQTGTVTGPYDHGEGRKPSWRWNAHGDEGKRIGELLRPYLSERRCARLDELLAETTHEKLPPQPRDDKGQYVAKDEEPPTVRATTPSGIEIAYSPAPRRHYRLRGDGSVTWDGPPYIGDPREWVEVPSVTTVLGVLDRSGPLTWWGQGVGVDGVLELVKRGRLKWVDA